MIRSVHIIYTTTSGHTEHLVDAFITYVNKHASDLHIIKQRAETSEPADLRKGDVLILACGTWNTDMAEGQLSPYMKKFLLDANDIDLALKPVTAIGLGDDRYHHTAKAVELLVDFLKSHNGHLFLPPLKVVNEPYGQEEKVRIWAEEFVSTIRKLPSAVTVESL